MPLGDFSFWFFGGFFFGGGYFSGFFFFGFGFGFFVVDVLMFCFERDVSVLTICQKKNYILARLPPTGYVITDRKCASWTDLGSANLARKA